MMSQFDPRIDPMLGVVRRCPLCLEVWPEDEEFYRRRDRGPCHACVWEMNDHRRRRLAAYARQYRARLRQSA